MSSTDPTHTNGPSNSLLILATTAGKVLAINVNRCKTRWEFSLDEAICSGVSLNSRLGFVGSYTPTSPEGAPLCIQAFDPKSGETAWKRPVEHGVSSGPVATDSDIYFLSNDGVHCLDADTGKSKWKIPLETNNVSSPLYYDSPYLYLAISGDGIYAINTDYGKLAFEQSFGSRGIEYRPSFTTFGKKLYVRTRVSLLCLNKKTGRTMWENTEAVPLTKPVILSDESIFLGSKQGLCVLSPDTGEVENTYPSHTPLVMLRSDSQLLCVDLRNRDDKTLIYSLDPAGRLTKNWITRLSTGKIPSDTYRPIHTGTKFLYIPLSNSRIYAVKEDSGDPLYFLDSFSKIKSVPLWCFETSSPICYNAAVYEMRSTTHK
jgi:outer membrane protein assembly factor BamB